MRRITCLFCALSVQQGKLTTHTIMIGGGKSNGSRPNYRASVGNVAYLYQQGVPVADSESLKAFILQQMYVCRSLS